MSTIEARVKVACSSRAEADTQFRDACAAVLGVAEAKALAGIRTLRIGGLSIAFTTDG